MANVNQLTIGDLLPGNMKSDYSQTVLDIPVSEARNIAKFGMPPPSGMSAEDVQEIKDLYSKYQNKTTSAQRKSFWKKEQSAESSGSFWNKDSSASADNDAYWHKSEADNDAYWNKNS